MTQMGEDTVILECERHKDKSRITARLRQEAVHIDVIDLANAQHRQRYARAVAQKLPVVKPEDVEAKLTRLADVTGPSSTTGKVSGDDDEIDLSRIVRPERFITPAVSGLTVPTPTIADGKPVGRWVTYLIWPDGRRERRDIGTAIDLPDRQKIWIHPKPAAPSPTVMKGWSGKGRKAWLEGSKTPDAEEVFRRLCQQIAWFIDLPEDRAPGTTATLALYVMLTYGYPAWEAVPYLYVGGPTGSGKTRLLAVLARMVFRPLESSNVTGPALFRTLDDRGGTLLYDEAERLRGNSPEIGELNSMLLAGYKRGGRATRLEPVGDTYRPVEFAVFGPKMLACISGVPPVLASRCIPIMMFRASPGSPKPRRQIDRGPYPWQDLGDDLHAIALGMGNEWLALAGRSDVCPEMSGRDYELWQPILALATWVESHGAEGLLSLVRNHALSTINGYCDETVPEADEVLLDVLVQEIRNGESPTSSELLAKCRQQEPTVFERWHPRTVASRLKQYGIPRARKVGDRREYRDVTLEHLRLVQQNYGIELDIPGRSPVRDVLPLTPSQPSQLSQVPVAQDQAWDGRDGWDARSEGG